jgi:tetratricopeptide (TPR) repeat protein
MNLRCSFRFLAMLWLTVAVGSLNAQTSLQFTSAAGVKFYSLPDDKGVVEAARNALAADPKNVELMLKLALAQSSVWQYREAVATCTSALALAPDNAALYTERGHRKVALRDFAGAREDLKRAVALDPKKLDAYYHLGLAHYFLGDFPLAAEAFGHAVDLATAEDSRVNSTNWLYASLRRANQREAAAKALARIPPEAKPGDGHTQFYFNLVRFFQGTLKESEVTPPEPPAGSTDTEAELQFDTVGYGVGNWHLYNGESAQARAYFQRIAKGRVWVTWGFVGAETELLRASK